MQGFKQVELSIVKQVEFDHAEKGVGYRLNGTEDSHTKIIFEEVKTIGISSPEEIPEVLLQVLSCYNVVTDYRDDSFTLSEHNNVIIYTRTENENGSEASIADHYAGIQIYHAEYVIELEIKDVYVPTLQDLMKIFTQVDVF
ncbi:hypothetical protein POF51_29750 [Brevibacillus sp. AG]|uniref:hypothetical protein n=1 Tax=Brevibacillus sp. AG TaxID=3020891 RepID=UPI00232D3A49|nr:hypothetical protein [Brevibacillus sp. AG]MDC0764909.1 hypothetical protein [Brevibacillus sp. AG]